MKDFLGKQLELGDTVVITAPRYRQFALATVIAFTPKLVRVEYINNWNYQPPGRLECYICEPSFLVKVVQSKDDQAIDSSILTEK